MGVTALVLGLLGIAVCWFPLLGWGGVALGALAFVVGVVAIKKGIKGLGIAGLLLGLIGIVWGISVQLEYLSAGDPEEEGQEIESPAPGESRPRTGESTSQGAATGDRL